MPTVSQVPSGRVAWAPYSCSCSSCALSRSTGSFGSFLGLLIDDRLGNFRQRGVGRLFFSERFFQEAHHLREVQFAGPSLQGAVARNLIVFDRLSSGEEAGIE